MKKILIIVCLGMFLGVASASAAEVSVAHQTAKTELKANKSASHKKGHKAHKKATVKASKKSQKAATVKQ